MDITSLLAQLGVPILLIVVVAAVGYLLVRTGIIRSIRIQISLSWWIKRARKHGATDAQVTNLVLAAAKFDMKK